MFRNTLNEVTLNTSRSLQRVEIMSPDYTGWKYGLIGPCWWTMVLNHHWGRRRG